MSNYYVINLSVKIFIEGNNIILPDFQTGTQMAA